MDALAGALADAGLPAQVIGVPPLFDVVFRTGEVRNYRDTLAADAAMAARFNSALRTHGILKGDSKFYVSLAHDDADVAFASAAFRAAAKELAATR